MLLGRGGSFRTLRFAQHLDWFQQRIYVHESVYDSFVSKFVDIAKVSPVVRLPIVGAISMSLRLIGSVIPQSWRQILDL